MKKVTVTVTKTFEVPDHCEAVTLPTGEVVLKVAENSYLWPALAYYSNDPIENNEKTHLLSDEEKECRALGVSGDWTEVEDIEEIYTMSPLVDEDVQILIS